MDWLGVGTAVRERSVATGAAGVRTATGRWLLHTSLDQLTGRYGVPAYTLHRSDLHQMLHTAAGRADLRTGHRVTAVTNTADGVQVHYRNAHGVGSASADLVIAADGVHSPVRHQLFPDHPGPTYAGYVTWRGVVPADTAPGNLPGLTETWGRGQRFGIAPLADGRVYWFATTIAAEGVHVDDDLPAVADRFAGWHEPIPQLLAATPRRRCSATTSTTWPAPYPPTSPDGSCCSATPPTPSPPTSAKGPPRPSKTPSPSPA